LAKGAKGNPKGRGAKIVRVAGGPAQSLAEQGIDKHLADRARKAAAIPESQFDADVAKSVKRAVAAVEGDKAIIREARAEQQREKKAKRAKRERELATKVMALPAKKYGVIYADPEWHDTVWSEETGMDRHASNHYPTNDAAVIASRPVAGIAAPDCVLFLWTTNQHLRIAIGVMEAWGFEYKSNYCWGKPDISMGRWNRSKHELLLIGTRGKPVCPAQGEQWDSLQLAPCGRHSAKPELFYEMIEEYFPNVPKIELNCRGRARPNWDGWGLELAAE
jgi:N6-adenosine-specific RNA methylase IME4